MSGTRERRTEQRDLRIWASCIAHDFGNLITLISCHAELLARSLAPGSQAQRDATALRSASRRANHLLSRWLDFYNKGPLRSEPVGLVQLFDEMIALARPTLGAKIQVTTNVESDELAVLADREHLERCLLNLLLNAKDAMQGTGTISLRARAARFEGQSVVSIEVADSGPGIPEELRERLFEPSVTTKRRGSGLGLAMVQAYVTENRGHVTARNLDDSGKACFTLCLPRARIAECSRDSQRPSAVERTAVLLVEPDPGLGPVLRRLLEASGYEVLWTPGAGEALLLAERSGQRVDGVVMDAPLAWMSCEELGARLKKVWPEVQTLALTWSGFESEGGIDRVLMKPCHGSVLLRELADLLASRPRQASYTRLRVANPLPLASNEES